MKKNGLSTEDIKLDLLLEAILRSYGYDLKNYSRTTIKRRVGEFIKSGHYTDITQLINAILHDRELFEKLLFQANGSDIGSHVYQYFYDINGDIKYPLNASSRGYIAFNNASGANPELFLYILEDAFYP